MKFIALPIVLFLSCTIAAFAQEDYRDKQELKESFVNASKHAVDAIADPDYKAGQGPKNIVLMIADGLGTTQLTAAYTANGGQLYMTAMPYTGFATTQSASHYVTDSAAAGTALATGVRTYKGAIAVDTNKDPLPTILEIAEEQGKSTGLVATSAITHATPAAFIAHNTSRHNYEAIAADFLETDIDLFIGGGKDFFSSRKDERNLLDELKMKHYSVFDSLEAAAEARQGPIAILTAGKHNPRWPERGELLPEGTQKAMEILGQNDQGYFLMVEGSQIDWGGHKNNTEFIVQETLDFDRAVGRALKLAAADGETLVIVTSDHETGGMSLATGNFEKGKIRAKYTSGGHTGVMVPVMAYGPGAEQFTGFMQNTDIFHKMHTLFGLKPPVIDKPRAARRGSLRSRLTPNRSSN